MIGLSVIVPIYNVHDYIIRCTDSLFQQTVHGIEYIFVDDYTSDDSVVLLIQQIKKYDARNKFKIQIIHLDNNYGQAKARNEGLKAASGEYVTFCDSDDWVELNAYQEMLFVAHESNADVIICDYFEETRKGTKERTVQFLGGNCKYVLENCYTRYLKFYLWNKIIRRSIIVSNGINFYEGINLWEDEGLLNRVFFFSDRLEQVHKPLYHYNLANIQSITKSSINDQKLQQVLDCACKLSAFFQDKGFCKQLDFIQFRARNIVLRDKFSDVKLYNKTFPNSGKYYKAYDLTAFSTLGRIRIWFTHHNLLYIAVCINKIFRMISQK